MQLDNKRILLIDHQAYWRKISTNALKRRGFAVGELETYNDLASHWCPEDESPDLVVLGCAHIGAEEQELIDDMLGRKYHLLVLCTSLSWQTMRMLFLEGVDDILDKPYNPAKLVHIVKQALENTSSGSSYRVAERNGLA